MKNILVTGAGAVLGQGILRCIRESKRDYMVHTADPDWRSTGHWLGNKAHIIPMATDSLYLIKIEEILEKEKIDVLLIGTDVELPIFSKEKTRLEKMYNVNIVVSNEFVIEIANDKWKTAEFLKENGFSYPYSYLTTDKEGMANLANKAEFPYFAKPVDGARSKGIVIINNINDLDSITSYHNNLVVQEFLPDTDGEFTSGCVVINGITQFVVTLKRDLRDGNTYRAYYDEEYEIYTPFIKMVAEKLGVDGPCNFQFRIKNNKPVIFEVNARFSGTTPIRSFFGSNEVIAILDLILYNDPIAQPKLREGVVLRAWADLFINKDVAQSFSNAEVVNNLNAEYFPFLKKK